MADFTINVPIVELNVNNFDGRSYQELVEVIHKSAFCSIDFELSGLGESSRCSSVQERYESVKKAAQTRSIVSVGLAFYVHNHHKQQSGCSLPFDVYVFDAKTLCRENFIIEPKAASFLIKHGFDFNHLFQTGLGYSLDDRDKIQFPKSQSQFKPADIQIRQVVLQIIRSQIPIVVHNGFCDLLFLYHHFYDNLPDRADVFQQNVNDLFRGGVYDTKYISFDSEDLSCSYLSYIFKKIHRNNVIKQASSAKHVEILFPKFKSLKPTINIPCKIGRKFNELLKGNNISLQPCLQICEKFAQSGFCLDETNCVLSHNVDDVLDAEYYFTHQRNSDKRRKLDHEDPENLNPDNRTKNDKNSSFGHRAGFDSFITGFCFAYFLLTHEKPDDSTELCMDGDGSDFLESNFNIEHVKNRLALMKRSHPFCLMKSNFVKMSTEHMKKSSMLF